MSTAGRRAGRIPSSDQITLSERARMPLRPLPLGTPPGPYGVTWAMKVAQFANGVRSTPEMYSVPIHTVPDGSETAAV